MHFHLILLAGVYCRESEGSLRFVPVRAPAPAELQGLVQRIAERIGRLVRTGRAATGDVVTGEFTAARQRW